ncbi:MAG: histidine triad nucleotide-binding protein [Candidatus Limnocylindria bacterium]
MHERDPECLFCKIASGEIPSDLVHTDDDVIAFRDVAPRAPTHVLVIPRRHIPDSHALTAADGDLLAKLFDVIRQVADAAGLENGYRLVTNIGPESGQTVFHLHVHLLGGRPMAWPPG